MKFTGHERDLGNPEGTGDDLDYMHARFFSPLTGRFISTDPIDSAVYSNPQSWNKYAYVLNNPGIFTDPSGKVFLLGQGSKEEALAAARLMVEPAAREAISLAADDNGQPIIAVDNSNKSTDANFKALQRAVNSPGVVEFNQVSPTDTISAQTGPGNNNPGITLKFTLGQLNQKGVTLPSIGTAIGNEGIFSDQPGITRIFVEQALTPQDLAPRMASELVGHALPALLGQGAAPRTRAEHVNRELPARALAIRNAQLPDIWIP